MSRLENLYICELLFESIILYHIDARLILLRYESSCMICTPEWYQYM